MRVVLEHVDENQLENDNKIFIRKFDKHQIEGQSEMNQQINDNQIDMQNTFAKKDNFKNQSVISNRVTRTTSVHLPKNSLTNSEMVVYDGRHTNPGAKARNSGGTQSHVGEKKHTITSDKVTEGVPQRKHIGENVHELTLHEEYDDMFSDIVTPH